MARAERAVPVAARLKTVQAGRPVPATGHVVHRAERVVPAAAHLAGAFARQVPLAAALLREGEPAQAALQHRLRVQRAVLQARRQRLLARSRRGGR